MIRKIAVGLAAMMFLASCTNVDPVTGERTRNNTGTGAIIGAIVAIAVVSYLILRISPKLVRFLGESGINSLSRMMGFIVLAIGIQFIANGVIPMLKEIMKG